MATIRERGGKIHVQIRKKGYPHLTKSFDSKEAAENWVKDTEKAMNDGDYKDEREAEDKTLADILIAHRDGHILKLKGYEQERDRINQILTIWKDAHQVSIKNLTQGMVTEYVKRREAAGVKGSTINREIAIVSSAINRAIASGLPACNPIEKIDRPKIGLGRDRRLKPGELDRLLDQLKPRKRDKNGCLTPGGADNKFVRWIVLFAIETAMRRSEILKLEWQYVDLDRQTAHLPATKNGHKRDVPLSRFAVRCLRVVQKMNGTEGKVFKTTVPAMRKVFERARDRAGLHDLRFHDLRHEATSRIAMKLDMLETSAVTGHRDPRMLKRYYHPDASVLAKKLG